jgi:predicted nuclease with TOPRIM domain
MKGTMQEILQDKIGFKLKLEEQRERLEMLSTENHHLKDKVTDLEADIKDHRKTIKSQHT